MSKAMEGVPVDEQAKQLAEAIERKELNRTESDNTEAKASLWKDICELRERLSKLQSDYDLLP